MARLIPILMVTAFWAYAIGLFISTWEKAGPPPWGVWPFIAAAILMATIASFVLIAN